LNLSPFLSLPVFQDLSHGSFRILYLVLLSPPSSLPFSPVSDMSLSTSQLFNKFLLHQPHNPKYLTWKTL
jgi:hypothetical protein